ncbi:MAG: hypothetical protein V4568_10955 [Pseudomonadota bacterium]
MNAWPQIPPDKSDLALQVVQKYTNHKWQSRSNDASQEWNENKSKFPTEYREHITALRDYFSIVNPMKFPEDLSTLEDARQFVLRSLKERQTSIRMEQSQEELKRLPKNQQSTSTTQAAAQDQGSDDENEGVNVSFSTGKKKKRKKPAKKGGAAADPFPNRSLKNEIIPALLHWQETKAIPDVLLTLDEKNKEAAVKLLLNVSDWNTFINKEHGDAINKVSEKGRKTLDRLSHTLENETALPENIRRYYADMIGDILDLKSSKETPWHAIQTMLLRWESAKETGKVSAEYHACFTETMNYFARAQKEFPRDDVENARQQALAGVRQEEQHRIKQQLTLEFLDSVLSTKETLSPDNVDNIIAVLSNKKKGKKSKGQSSQALNPEITEMPIEDVQQSLMKDSKWNEFLEQAIEKDDDDIYVERMEELEEKLIFLQSPLNPLKDTVEYIRIAYLYEHHNPGQSAMGSWVQDLGRQVVNGRMTKEQLRSFNAIRNHFHDKPNEIPADIEEAREQAIQDTEQEIRSCERKKSWSLLRYI